MNFVIQQSGLGAIHDQLWNGGRLTEDQAVALFRSRDLNAVGALADRVNRRRNGRRASYILNRYINYSNYCILSCQFCAFARKKRDGDGFELSVEEIVTKAREALHCGITELHIVGGLHPSLPFSYYLDMLRSLKALDGRLQLKCFTAVEVLHLAWLAKKTVPETLRALQEAGLDSLTGGGAEIFRPGVREAIAKGKETAEEWLAVHETWHRLGGRSTCTMLYGHLESIEDRVDHLRQLRELQDRTGGFTGFIPLALSTGEQRAAHRLSADRRGCPADLGGQPPVSGQLRPRDGLLGGLGFKLAQVALSFGADDLHGTIGEEHIFHMAGASSPQLQTEADMIKAIRESGRTPVQRDTFYRPVKVWDAPPRTEARGTR
jgi:aminodeoxyfutalosine synthase